MFGRPYTVKTAVQTAFQVGTAICKTWQILNVNTKSGLGGSAMWPHHQRYPADCGAGVNPIVTAI